MNALMDVIGIKGQYIACYNTLITKEDFNIILRSCESFLVNIKLIF